MPERCDIRRRCSLGSAGERIATNCAVAVKAQPSEHGLYCLRCKQPELSVDARGPFQDRLFFDLWWGLTRCQSGAGACRSRGFRAARVHEEFTTQRRPPNQEWVKHFRSVFQSNERPKQFRTEADRDLDHRPFFRSQGSLYVSPLDDRKLKSPAAPASPQLKLGDIVSYYEISRIQ